MNKKLLASAIAASLLGATAAHAQVTLIALDDGDATDALTYASEIDVAATGTTLTDAAEVQNLTTALGFSINAGDNRFIRVDLGADATFTNNPGLTITGPDGAGGTSTDTGTVSSGGMGESFVIFEVTAGDDRDPTDTVVVDVKDIDVVSESDVTARYRLYETATAAVNEDQSLADESDTAYTFGAGLNIVVEDAGEKTIDVATNSTKFTDTTTNTPIADIAVGVNFGVLFKDSTEVELTELLDTGTEFIVTGDFSAVAVDTNGDPDPAQVTLDAVAADALTANEAVFEVGSSIFDGGSEGAPGIVTMNVTGEDAIADVCYTGLYDVVAPAMADTQDQDLGELSCLEKNGTTARANFLLTPGGAFKNFVRITNPSGIDGRVFVRLTNDAGESAAFDLGDITVNNGGTDEQLVAELAAGNATPLIEVGELFAAATGPGSDNPDFDVAGGPKANKMRLEVDGEFGNPGTPTAIRVDVLSVSNDNKSFFQFATDNFDSATQNDSEPEQPLEPASVE